MSVRLMRRVLTTLGAVALTGIAIVFAASEYDKGSSLRVSIVSESVDIGIPGISKMYHARLVNVGRLPIRVSRCDYIDDTMSKGTQLAYAVERWDVERKTWVRIAVDSEDSFCKPYPLGIIKGNLRSGWLWPGSQLQTSPEATGARFKRGDSVRLVVFWGKPGDFERSVVTQPFEIDEQLQDTATPYRISH